MMMPIRPEVVLSSALHIPEHLQLQSLCQSISDLSNCHLLGLQLPSGQLHGLRGN